MKVIRLTIFLGLLALIFGAIWAPPSMLADIEQPFEHPKIEVPPHRFLAAILIDDAFTPEENDVILEAKYVLDYETNGVIQMHLVHTATIHDPIGMDRDQEVMPIFMKRVWRSDPYVIEKQTHMKDSMLLGYFDADGVVPTIYIVRDTVRTNNELLGTVVHEALHSARLSHSLFNSSLMSPVITTNCLSQRDTMQVAHIYHQDVDQMRPCYFDVPACLEDEPWQY